MSSVNVVCRAIMCYRGVVVCTSCLRAHSDEPELDEVAMAGLGPAELELDEPELDEVAVAGLGPAEPELDR
jgi:hypothetical protein